MHKTMAAERIFPGSNVKNKESMVLIRGPIPYMDELAGFIGCKPPIGKFCKVV